MPRGKGTYGSKVGRPRKKSKMMGGGMMQGPVAHNEGKLKMSKGGAARKKRSKWSHQKEAVNLWKNWGT